MARIGFIGLGTMGAPMAGHLLGAGHELLICASSPAAADFTARGATVCASVADVARIAEIMILALPDTPHVGELLFGDCGIADVMKPGSLLIDMSTISPLATKSFAAQMQVRGIDYLDAPVSGGEIGAKAATLTIMVGGTDEAFARGRPLFELMGKNITHVGSSGDGQTTKVANQIIVALNISAVAEALLFASKAGADPVKVREALLGGFANSRVLEVHAERMLNRTFDPGFRIALHMKDLGLALAGGTQMGLPLPQTAFCQQLLNAAHGAGDGALDHSAILTVLERLANHSLCEH